MKSWLVLVLAVTGCGAGDDTTSGARAQCAEGGAINACPDADHSPEAACWRMVDCGAIPVSSGSTDKHFDWGDCVDRIDGSISTAEILIIDCIAASTCDSLRVDGSPDAPDEGQMLCFHLGGR